MAKFMRATGEIALIMAMEKSFSGVAIRMKASGKKAKETAKESIAGTIMAEFMKGNSKTARNMEMLYAFLVMGISISRNGLKISCNLRIKYDLLSYNNLNL